MSTNPGVDAAGITIDVEPVENVDGTTFPPTSTEAPAMIKLFVLMITLVPPETGPLEGTIELITNLSPLQSPVGSKIN